MATQIKVYRKQNPDRLMFTVPNGEPAGGGVGDPLRHGAQWYQLDGLSSLEAFRAAESPLAKLHAIGNGISGATLERLAAEDVAALVAAWAEFAGVVQG